MLSDARPDARLQPPTLCRYCTRLAAFASARSSARERT